MATVKRTFGGLMTSDDITTGEAQLVCDHLFDEVGVRSGGVYVRAERLNNALRLSRLQSVRVVQCWVSGGPRWYEIQLNSNGLTLAKAQTPAKAFAIFAIGLGIYSA